MGGAHTKLIDSLHKAPLGCLITDVSGIVRFANQSIEDKTGFACSDIVGRRPGDFWGGKMSPAFYAGMWNQISHHKTPFVGLVKNSRRLGGDFERPLHIAPLIGADGTLVGYLECEAPTKSTKSRFSKHFVSAFLEPVSSKDAWNFVRHWFLADKRIGCSALPLASAISPIFGTSSASSRDLDAGMLFAAQVNGYAFSVLISKYKGLIESFFVSRVADPEVREELWQDTFERAFKALPRFETGCALYGTYLLRIAHNVWVNWLRSQHTEVMFDETQDLGHGFSRHQSTMARLEFEDLKRLLTLYEWAVVEERFLKGFSIKQISENFGKSENAIKLTLARVRRKARQSRLGV